MNGCSITEYTSFDYNYVIMTSVTPIFTHLDVYITMITLAANSCSATILKVTEKLISVMQDAIELGEQNAYLGTEVESACKQLAKISMRGNK